MKLTWYGHSCFMLENGEDKILFDPYQPGTVPGVELPADICADAVYESHQHHDHCYPGGIRLSGRTPEAKITRVPCFHDECGGKKRGSNLITVVETGGKRIAHFGDLGHILSDEQVKALGKLDVILIPIGGFYTVNAREAFEIVSRFAPCVVVPMHYKGVGFGYDVIAEVTDYTKLCSDLVRIDSPSFKIEEIATPATVLLRCPIKK